MNDHPAIHPLVLRYNNQPAFAALSYATVRDFCDSAEALPQLATHQNDLKDVERPWTVKAILNRVPPGSHLVEIGSGEPLAASILADLGYRVTICDPFDGSGNGPTAFEEYQRRFPKVTMIRALFTPEVARQMAGKVDCVYSISVLEHVQGVHLVNAFEATQIALRPGGFSIHAVDHVLQGNGDAWHAAQVAEIIKHQKQLTGETVTDTRVQTEVLTLFRRAKEDLDTFYLSPQGHNLWRGTQTYDTFPFRRCIAVQTIAQKGISQPARNAS